MWYMGNENMLNYTENDVPYIIGQHDTIMLMGKVNNAERTIITVAIGEKEDYKDILAANFDGSLGNSGSEDIHHQGYDYEAEKIYDSLVAYDANLSNPRWKKAYFITGYGTGGAVANLVAKKFIDYKHNDSNIYCYTYQAPNTINRNNLTSKIHNTKYHSIFNIENTDDIMLNLVGDDAGWTKYGVKKYLSVGDDPKTKKSWQYTTGKTYKGGSGFLQNLFSSIVDIFKSVFGFTGTQCIKEINYVTDPEELYKAIKAEKIKYTNVSLSNAIIRTINTEQNIVQGAEINNKGNEAQKQSEDTSSNIEMIQSDNMETKKPDVINTKDRPDYKTMAEALKTIASWHCEHVYTYNPYSTTDFKRNGNLVTFSGRFKYDYDKASPAAKEQRETLVNAYNSLHPTEPYLIDSFIDPSSYKLNLETFIGNHGDHGLYECEHLKDDCYSNYKKVGDDCSSMTMAVMYYATRGAMDEYSALNIYDLGGGALADTKPGKDIYDALEKIGFKKIAVKNGSFDELESGDLLVSSNHYEFYYKDENGNHKSFGWGSVKNTFPNTTCSIKESIGNKYFKDKWDDNKKYTYIYRLVKENVNDKED